MDWDSVLMSDNASGGVFASMCLSEGRKSTEGDLTPQVKWKIEPLCGKEVNASQ
jgi:hypothetical protein